MASFVQTTVFVIFGIYAAMALFISLRDIFTTKHKTLWISVIGVAIAAIIFLFFTRYFNLFSLPLALLISIPIFITDKRRGWDIVDQVFRWVSLATVIIAVMVMLNAFMR